MALGSLGVRLLPMNNDWCEGFKYGVGFCFFAYSFFWAIVF